VKKKLAIFSDADAVLQPVVASTSGKGWESIGSLAERKKENVIAATPWVGETLKAGGKKTTGAAKLSVFRDPVSSCS
jgi:checkpoint serine/threonine-protein kinase